MRKWRNRQHLIKSSIMNIEEFREYCLSLGEITEKTPFGKFAARFDSVLVFYVCDHMFCMVDMDNFTYAVVKNTPEKIAELHETRNSVERQRNMMAKYWIQLNFGGDVSDSEILDLVKQSYEIVKAKYLKKK
ncbi:MAG: MmcQ/YjbR family DNA-binding protein [Muribaculaceae bacterium]|nr:MmcQ/YjbR family DNA-binding protein [Muribaculaceae bacterium]